MGLWDRVMEKRQQSQRDTDQDKEIQQLKKQIEETQKKQEEPEQPPFRRGGGYDAHGYIDVADSLERSRALISREFDLGWERLGSRFAIGDAITENRLQAQVIALQQTVIAVLQDALCNGRQLGRADMERIVAASDAARDGSLEALRQQRQRQLSAIDNAPVPRRPRQLTGRPVPRVPSPPSSDSTTIGTMICTTEELFCQYSLSLQDIKRKPMAASFAPGRSCRCPTCGVRLDVEADDHWEIRKRMPAIIREGGRDKEALEEREFHVGQRFAVKCHTAGGQYACVLCNRFRERDVICPTVDLLVKHVGEEHSTAELEQEEDFDMASRMRPLPRALPAPTAAGSVRG